MFKEDNIPPDIYLVDYKEKFYGISFSKGIYSVRTTIVDQKGFVHETSKDFNNPTEAGEYFILLAS